MFFFAAVGLSTYLHFREPVKLILKNSLVDNGIIIELGETIIPEESSDYLSDSCEQEYLDNSTVDFSNVDFSNVGEYELIIEYEAEKVTVDVIIKDTTPPVIAIEKIKFAAGGGYSVEDLKNIFVVSDFSNYDVEINTDCNFDKEGEYYVKATATDEHGNESSESSSVEIVSSATLSGYAVVSSDEGRQSDNGDVLIYVSKTGTKLSQNYVPTDLVSVGSYGAWGMIKSVVLDAYKSMYEAALSEGIDYLIISPYRDYALQLRLFNQYSDRDGVENAKMYSALPGTSEHQTGYAIDVSTANLGYSLSEEMGSMPEGIWLENNAHKYGFIVRYPKNKTYITGYIYEPWHLRYLGVDVATEIHNKGITFDEYVRAY